MVEVDQVLLDLISGEISYDDASSMIANIIADSVDAAKDTLETSFRQAIKDEIRLSEPTPGWPRWLRRKIIIVRLNIFRPHTPAPLPFDTISTTPIMVCGDPTCMPCSRLKASGAVTETAAFGHDE